MPTTRDVPATGFRSSLAPACWRSPVPWATGSLRVTSNTDGSITRTSTPSPGAVDRRGVRRGSILASIWKRRTEGIPREHYSRDYYLSASCEGFDEFRQGHGV